MGRRQLHALTTNGFFYPGRKDTIKASIYVKDLAKALFELPEKLSNGLHLYNAGNLKNPTITEIVKAMANETGKSSNLLVLNKKLLLLAGFVLKNFFGKKEYDPDRIKKLTVSTNINSKKLHKLVKFDFSLEEGIKDWLKDINPKKSP
jgi:nucleoside-diphosphate-sugar epimerase